MKKKIINVSSITIIVLTVVSLVTSAATSIPASGKPLSLQPGKPEAGNVQPFAGFLINQVQTVNFDIDEQSFALLTQREKRDQALDWLLFTVVSNSGLSLKEINQASFDLPPVRYGYLQPSAKFEFGQTRSIQIGKGQVVALIPANEPSERIALLADIADRQRTSTGKMPTVLLTFEYELAPDLHSATITRTADLKGSDLFSPAYGYYQFNIPDLNSLEQALTKLDDITFAEVHDGVLTVGGRDFDHQSMLGVNTEDVAAVWQAFVQVDQQYEQFCSKWISRFKQEIKNDVYLSLYLDSSSLCQKLESYIASLDESSTPCIVFKGENPAAPSEPESIPQPLQSFFNQMKEDRKNLGIVGGLGFSLDPYVDFQGLHQFYSGKRADYEAVVDSLKAQYPGILDINLDCIDSALTRKDAVPYRELAQTLELIGEMYGSIGNSEQAEKIYTLTDEANKALETQFVYQAARYDGNLQGTKVGMTLFYTDLLAKLWSIDYAGSAPRTIEDFIPSTEIRLSEVFKQEITENPDTRLWFGPQKQGFQVGSDNNELFFDRVSTRVYSASSNPLQPGVETSSTARFSKYLGWWNDHYAEVARYEPQYERLNAIMKWSLVISWLGNSNQEGLLRYLKDVSVDRNNRFPDWVQTQPELRYQQWDAIAFHEPGYLDNKTETLPILVSGWFNTFPSEYKLAALLGIDGLRHISGGVSLADNYLFTTVKPIPELADELLLRPGLGSYANNLLQTADNITYEFTDLSSNVFKMTATLPEELKLRGIDNEVETNPIERIVSPGNLENGLQISTEVQDVPIGSLQVAADQNGFRVGWLSRDIDQVQQVARGLSEGEPYLQVLDDPNIHSVIVLPGKNNFLVQFTASDRWMHISEISDAGGGTSTIAWQSRVASLTNGDHIIGIQWDGEVLGALKSGERSYLVGGLDEPKYFTLVTKDLPGSVKPVKLQVGEHTFDAWVNPETQQIYYSLNDLPEPLQTHPELLKNLVRSTDFPGGAMEASMQLPEIRLGELSSFAEDVSKQDYHALAKQIIDDPKLFYTEKNAFLDDNLATLDNWIQSGRSSEALAKVDKLIDIYGERPELVLRKSMILMDEHLPSQLMKELNTLAARPAEDVSHFFDEVNARLAMQGPESADLYTMSQYLEWQSLQSNALYSGGKLQIIFDGKKFGLHYVMDTKPSGIVFNTGKIGPNVPVYVQDSPVLSNLDWPVSINDSLNQVVSGDLGKVIVVPRGDIAGYRPGMIFDSDGLGYGLIPQSEQSIPTSFLRFDLLRSTQPQCDLNDVNNQRDCVVFVIANEK